MSDGNSQVKIDKVEDVEVKSTVRMVTINGKTYGLYRLIEAIEALDNAIVGFPETHVLLSRPIGELLLSYNIADQSIRGGFGRGTEYSKAGKKLLQDLYDLE